MARRLAVLAAGAACLWGTAAAAQTIDREALVRRHNPELRAVDRHAPLMIGNGDIGFTADITGLQTFPEQYSTLAPLLTMAQWAWHSFPNPEGYDEADGLVQVPVPGGGAQPYPYIKDWAELETRPALRWLRENPHRFSLGRVGLAMTARDGAPARFDQITDTRQRLDMWTGALLSDFRFEGQPVSVETRVHPVRDMIMVSITSVLVANGRLGVDVRYPGVSPKINPDPSAFDIDDTHHSLVVAEQPGRLALRRALDDTVYYSTIAGDGAAIARTGPHGFRVTRTGSDSVTVLVSFDQAQLPAGAQDYQAAVAEVTRHWQNYWARGGAIDFSGSTDPRARELERRVVLSQYLAAVNQAGELPPQEEGLFSNSWNGKFHLEVHPLHAAHFASWGKPELLERSLAWYVETLPRAQAVARRHGVEGAWWTKMTGPEGRNSPSTVNPFIMWQQPHPIYMAELVYRADPGERVLSLYADLVEETGKMLASWPRREASGRIVLGPPIIPVQENHPPLTTVNPAFEVEYFRWGIETAQRWRERRGLPRNAAWDKVVADLAPPPQQDGLYLPVESRPDFWDKAMSAQCSRHAEGPDCLNRDHPSFLMAWGWIEGSRTDAETMRRTLRAVETHWDLRQTWGWDFPTVAMTAARLGEPEQAIDWLFSDLPNNRWGVSGMTPRVHLEAERQLIGPAAANAANGPDGPGFRRAAETYFPSNGSLLLAVGMMAAGWEGSQGEAPGFPKGGWRVRVEGIRPLP